MQNYEIVDNFLSQSEFERIKNFILSESFSWTHVHDINVNHNKNSTDSYFVHMFYDNGKGRSVFFEVIAPILEKIKLVVLLRIKCNLYYNTNELKIHKPHVDYDIPHQGAIYYLNTNNGKTILEDGTRIDSIENRMFFFDSHKPHSSTSTTDKKFRVNINFNYI